MKFKKLFVPILCIIFIFCLAVYSKTSVAYASKGISLWLNIVFPSLFPFFVVSSILTKTGFVKTAGILLERIMRPVFNVPGCGSFALLLGVTSGYPVGARITAELWEDGLISKTEAERLLTFTNNSGPLFIIGAVGTGMYSMPRIGIFLLICHIAACLTVGFLFRFYKRNGTLVPVKRSKRVISDGAKHNGTQGFGEMFGDCVKNSVLLILTIGGYIIFFSVLIGILLKSGLVSLAAGLVEILLCGAGIDSISISAVLSGAFEITTGTNILCSAASVPLMQKLVLTSLIIGWAGFSVHSQVWGIIGKTGINIRPYLAGKLLQGVIAAFYTFIGIKAAGSYILSTLPVFKSIQAIYIPNWSLALAFSIRQLIMALIAISVCMLAAVSIRAFSRHKRQST